MRGIRRNIGIMGATALLLTSATQLAAHWGGDEQDAALRDYRAAVDAAEPYVQGAMSRPDVALAYVAPQFDGQIPARLSDTDKLRLACRLVEAGDQRYHRYLELVQLRVRVQAQSRPLPERMSAELTELRQPPMQPRHLVRSRALLDACDRRADAELLAARSTVRLADRAS